MSKQIRTRLQLQSAKQEQVLQTLKANHEKVLVKRKREVSVEKARVSKKIISGNFLLGLALYDVLDAHAKQIQIVMSVDHNA